MFCCLFGFKHFDNGMIFSPIFLNFVYIVVYIGDSVKKIDTNTNADMHMSTTNEKKTFHFKNLKLDK